MKEALEILADADTPLVAVVGHRTRTRYVDHDMLYEVLSILRQVRVFRPVHAGHLPFDLYLEQVCERMGLMDVLLGPEDRKERLQPYERTPAILDQACLVLNFPPEGGDPDDSDPDIIGLALKLKVPVLSVDREGNTTLTRTRT